MRIRFIMLAVLLSGLPLSGSADAQGRPGLPGGMPPGIPAGIPMGIPMGPPSSVTHGIPNGPPGGLPAAATDHIRGGLGEAATHAAAGLDQARAALKGRLSKPERNRADALLQASPQTYELDRHGALVIRGEVMVAGLDAAQIAHLQEAGFHLLRQDKIPALGLTLAVVTTNGMAATRAVKKLRNLEPNGHYALNHVLFESGRVDPEPTANANLRRSTSNDGASDGAAVVGLIDTGVAAQALAAPRIQLTRRNFAPTPSKADLHGTAVASLLAREPGKVSIYAADIFGSGGQGGTSELLIRALGWMAREDVPVINVSMVGPPNDLVAAVVAAMVHKGFTIVAPVGNDGPAARPMFPASYPGVIAVSGALGSGNLLPEASRVMRVDFVAPGIATVPGPSGGSTLVRGTSFAAPIVSRLFADHVRSPDAAASHKAFVLLAKQAVRPQTDSKYFGLGLIGTNAPSLASN